MKNHMLWIATGLLLSCGMAKNSSASTQTWLDPNFVKQAFLEVSLKNEYSQETRHLTKWEKPIKVWIQHKVADQALHDHKVNGSRDRYGETIRDPPPPGNPWGPPRKPLALR